MTTTKSINGWTARTEVPLNDKQFVEFRTTKHPGVGVMTVAIVFEKKPIGASGVFFNHHFIHQDFCQRINNDFSARATERTVERMHRAALEHLDEVKQQIEEFYRAKAKTCPQVNRIADSCYANLGESRAI